jgi:hypothetical protein
MGGSAHPPGARSSLPRLPCCDLPEPLQHREPQPLAFPFDINAAHAHARAQGLTEEHLDVFLKHFRAAIDEVGVAPDKAEKVMRLLEAQRAAVLNR